MISNDADGVLFALPPEMRLQPTQVCSQYAPSGLTDQPQSIPRPTSQHCTHLVHDVEVVQRTDPITMGVTTTWSLHRDTQRPPA